MTILYTVLAIIVGAWLLCFGAMAATLCIVSALPAPKPVPSKEQMVWWRAEAKLAQRRYCTYCSSQATITCRNHRRLLCGGENCYALHRLSVRPDPCACFDYKPLRGWKQHLLATAVALAVGTLLMWVVAL